jgi:MoxR-like ATPase
LQNKLFPIVHERIVQGIPLDKLRHRWGAMNPPPAADGARPGASHEYAGAEPLDIALADRFGFIIPVPSLGELARLDQLTLLRGVEPAEDVAPRLRSTLEAIGQAIPSTGAALRLAAADYVQLLAAKLAAADHPISTRRAVQLVSNIIAVNATMTVTAAAVPGHSEDAFYLAVRYSLPNEGWGAPIPQTTLLTAHRAAWQLVKLDERSEVKAILIEPDAVRRIALTLSSSLTGAEAGRIVVDAFASLSRLARLATAAVLAPLLAQRPDWPVATIEPIARDFALLAASSVEQIVVQSGGADWRRTILSTHLAALDRDTIRGGVLTNAAVRLMQEDERFEMPDLEAAYDHAAQRLGDSAPGPRTHEMPAASKRKGRAA